MREEIIELCKKINSFKCCPNCSGSISFNTCEWCHQKIEELDNYIKELETKLTLFEQQFSLDIFENIFIISMFNHLYSINRFQIPKVNEWLTKSNYKKVINTELNTIIKNVNASVPLTEQNYTLIWFLMDNNLLNEKLKMNWLNLLMKGIAQKKLNLDENEFKKIICSFSEEVMRTVCNVEKPHCEIVNLKTCNGYAKDEQICISTDSLKKAIEGNIFSIIQTDFHEVTHVKQYEDRENKIISWFNIMILKDKILSIEIPNYYDDNYVFLPSEAQAELEGISGAINYMKFLELPMSKEELEKIEQYKKLYNETIVNTSRKFNDKYIEVDEIFDEYIKNKSELLIKYPQLSLEYVNDNNLVRKKYLEEVSKDYENYLNGTLKLNGREDEIKFYFENLIKTLSETKLQEF